MADCKLVSIRVHVGGGGEQKKTLTYKDVIGTRVDGKVEVDVIEYPYVSAVAKGYLDQGWKISGSNVGGNSVILLLTR